MQKSLDGELFHEIEKMGNEDFAHIGFRDKDNSFGDMMATFVPEIGMTKKVRITIEILED